MTAVQLITGTVAGFALVIDPNNEQGKRDEVRYANAAQMKARISELSRENALAQNADPQHYDPIETLYQTLYRRDDNGNEEREDGFDMSGKTEVGTLAYKAMCTCGKTSWFKLRKGFGDSTPVGKFTCPDCNDADRSIHDHDFTNYDGMREREY